MLSYPKQFQITNFCLSRIILQQNVVPFSFMMESHTRLISYSFQYKMRNAITTWEIKSSNSTSRSKYSQNQFVSIQNNNGQYFHSSTTIYHRNPKEYHHEHEHEHEHHHEHEHEHEHHHENHNIDLLHTSETVNNQTDINKTPIQRKKRNLPKRLSGIQKYTLSIYRQLIRVANDKNREAPENNALLQRIRTEFRERKDMDRAEMERIEYWVRFAERNLEMLRDAKGMSTIIISRKE